MNAARRKELVEERLAAVRDLVERRGATAALLRARRNFAWVTAGGENHVILAAEDGVADLLITPGAATVITAVNEAARIRDEELSDLPIELEAVPWHDPDATEDAIRRIGGASVLADADLEEELLPLRSILADVELERLGWLASRAVAAVRRALDGTVAGMTEHEVAGIAAGALAVEGIRTPVLLAAADARIDRYRHPLPTDQPVAHRLMLVAVAERWGLHAAVTRFAELTPPDAKLAERMAAVERIHAAMVRATRPGATLGDVFEATQAAYAAEGHPDEWKLHHQGGSIGYQGRERIATPGDPTVVRDGMAFAWNPSITGAKAEDTIVLRPDGPVVLTTD